LHGLIGKKDSGGNREGGSVIAGKVLVSESVVFGAALTRNVRRAFEGKWMLMVMVVV
jgi:hypothetical protein